MQKKEAKILALDFDGVIADSQLECFVVGYAAYRKLVKETSLLNNVRITPENVYDLLQKNQKLYQKYTAIRPFVLDAFSFFVIFHALDHAVSLRSPEEYLSLRGKLINYHAPYVDLFYETRFSWIEHHFDHWLELLSPYNHVLKAINPLREHFRIVVATNNSKRSVSAFLNKFGMEPELMVTKEVTTNKVEQINLITKKLETKHEDVFFIDDNVHHLELVKKTGAHCYLAGWGYNTKEQQRAAKQQDIPILERKNFHNKLFKDAS